MFFWLRAMRGTQTAAGQAVGLSMTTSIPCGAPALIKEQACCATFKGALLLAIFSSGGGDRVHVMGASVSELFQAKMQSGISAH